VDPRGGEYLAALQDTKSPDFGDRPLAGVYYQSCFYINKRRIIMVSALSLAFVSADRNAPS